MGALPGSLWAQRLLRYLLVFYLLPTGSKLLFYVQKKLENIEFYNCADACFMQPCRIKEFRVINSTTPACTVKILAVYIYKAISNNNIQNIRPICPLGSVTDKRFNTYLASSPTTRPKRESFLQMSFQKRGCPYLCCVSQTTQNRSLI